MGKKNYSAYDHASHNLKAHNFLKESGEFKDWEVTTAFYSSMKFFEGCLFPNDYPHPKTGEKIEFNSYNDYKSIFNRFIGGTPHESMKFFVEKNTNDEIWVSYKSLYDICHSSRYKNYMIEDGNLEIARESLEEIRQYCLENQC